MQPGELAIRCPACPQPGINLPENWQSDPETFVHSPTLVQRSDNVCRWKYMRSVVLDGNFSAQHHHMRNPDDDVPLADGHAFMVTEAPYKAHLQSAKEFQEVRVSFKFGVPARQSR